MRVNGIFKSHRVRLFFIFCSVQFQVGWETTNTNFHSQKSEQQNADWLAGYQAAKDANTVGSHQVMCPVFPDHDASISQCENWEDPGSWDDDLPSDLFEQIKEIVGKNHVDAQHLDAAIKARCTVFLTSDKGDIWNRREKLYELTGLTVLHMPT